MESWAEGGEGLLDPAGTTSWNQAGTSGHSRHDVTVLTVKCDKRQSGQYSTYKYSTILIAACIMSLVISVPTSMYQEKRPSKYKAQLHDCGVPEKIQVLIPEKCSNKTREG